MPLGATDSFCNVAAVASPPDVNESPRGSGRGEISWEFLMGIMVITIYNGDLPINNGDLYG